MDINESSLVESICNDLLSPHCRRHCRYNSKLLDYVISRIWVKIVSRVGLSGRVRSQDWKKFGVIIWAWRMYLPKLLCILAFEIL